MFMKVAPMVLGRRPGSSDDAGNVGHVPWTGIALPLSLRVEAPGTFIRRDNGTWCRSVATGRLYPANRHGVSMLKPRRSLGDGVVTPVAACIFEPAPLVAGAHCCAKDAIVGGDCNRQT